ncbi:unnamed protein product [Somion occarium]|uniref:Uncharacterized protein n=1 Tax=Somion occarium TaxID=3059160 RepID=A0ABP1CHN6_9APHY
MSSRVRPLWPLLAMSTLRTLSMTDRYFPHGRGNGTGWPVYKRHPLVSYFRATYPIMRNLIVSRTPSLVLFGTLQVVLWGFVWRQWHEPGHIKTPLKSAIPRGHLGQTHAYT